jgi:nuclear transport factor 2 (NTF2) superfamily protein
MRPPLPPFTADTAAEKARQHGLMRLRIASINDVPGPFQRVPVIAKATFDRLE